MEALSEEDEPEDSTATTEASAEEVEETTCPSERLRQWSRWCVYGTRELTTTTAALDQGLRNNDRGIVGGLGIDDAYEVLETTMDATGDR